jgi:hypothetical protein
VGDPADHLLGHGAGILEEPTEVADGTQLHSEPEPVGLAPALAGQLAVALIEEEEELG